MTTAADLIEATRRHLLGSARDSLDKVAGALTDSATTVTSTFSNALIAAGVRISVDLEDMHVWSIAGTPTVATVERGVDGSTAAAHLNGALIRVHTRFTPFQIFSALNDEIDDLSSPSHGLYAITTVTHTTTGGTFGYDLTGASTVEDIARIDMAMTPDATEDDWERIPTEHFRLLRNQDTAIFPSGFAIDFITPLPAGRALRILYKSRFVRLTSLTSDLLTTAKIPVTAHDIPALGAAARLLAGSEGQRSNVHSQSSPHRAADVPPSTNVRSSQYFMALRAQRIRAEATRLSRAYPMMKRR